VELWVDGEGPSLSARQRRHMLRPEGRQSFGADGADAIQIAIRLIRGFGGDLTVESRTGGGESFRISWPASIG